MLQRAEALIYGHQSTKYMAAVIFAFLSLVTTECVNASPILVCDDQPHVAGGTAYVLDAQNNRAYIPRNDGKREGILVTTNDFYNIKFEGSVSVYPLEITVNRYTGNFELEFGDEPFGNFSPRNVYRTGTCQLLKEPKL